MHRFAAVLCATTFLAAGAAQAMTLDGRLDEAEWGQAQSFSDFRVTEPLTRVPAAHATELLVLPLPDALYVGMRAEYPPAQLVHGHSPRDAAILDADPAILIIDFEGQGKTAYEFTVSLSGTQRDSIILNQSEFSTDWDADWIATMHENPTGWSAEWRIPWSVAPEGTVHGDRRTIGIYAGRFIKHEAVRYAFPAIELHGPNFVRDMHRIEVPRYATGSLDIYPYVSFTHDAHNGGSQGRAGLDVFWKPNGRHQLSAALNPDFGQVESDDLVVNFSAVETFFEEKRPFFTQGQQLFDLRTTEEGRLVNTRRIGAAPDLGPEGGSDVLAAGKYTGIHGDHEYGVFGAVERDSQQALGRRFFAGRWRRVHDDFSLGYLGTGTLHPSLHRDAFVHAVDVNLRPSRSLAFSSQALLSDIREPASIDSNGNGIGSHDRRGYGGWARLDYQAGGRWQHSLRATWFDRALDFNDLGYQQRADLAELELDSLWFIRKYREGSLADNGDWHADLQFPYSTRGERLLATSEIGHDFQWRNGAFSYFSYLQYWPGYDDLITRGNGSLRFTAGHNWHADYFSPVLGRFRFQIDGDLIEESYTSHTRAVKFKPKWFLTEDLSLGLELDYFHSPQWLLWTQGREVATYKRRELDSIFTVNWYPAPKQELRLKVQWVGLDARALQAYTVQPDGQSLPGGTLPHDFTINTLGLQLRYRYEFHPLSDLYVVYSRGGDGSLADRSESLGSQFRRALNEVNTSLLFVKLRYRI